MIDFPAIDTPAIVVTASRAEQPAETPASITAIGAGTHRAAWRTPGSGPAAADAVGLGRHQRHRRIADAGAHSRRRGQPHPAVRRRHPRQRSRRPATSRASSCSTPTWPPDRSCARTAVGAVGIGSNRRRRGGRRRSEFAYAPSAKSGRMDFTAPAGIGVQSAATDRGWTRPARERWHRRVRYAGRRRSRRLLNNVARGSAALVARAIELRRERLRDSGGNQFDGFNSLTFQRRRHARQNQVTGWRRAGLGSPAGRGLAAQPWRQPARLEQPQFPRRDVS